MNINRIISLTKKEIRSYFNVPSGFVAIASYGIFAGLLYVKTAFLTGDGSMRGFFDTLIWLLLILVPVLGMGSLASEKKSNTIEILYALPILKSEIVLSKFVALYFMCLLSLGVTLIIPVTLLFISTPHITTIIVSYIGLLLISGMMCSIVILFSSVTSNSIIAFLISILTIFCMLVLGSNLFTSILPRVSHSILYLISPTQQATPFFKGIIDLRSIVFFLSIIMFSLLITNRLISKSR